MNFSIYQGIWTPFLGTVLGSACVFFMKGAMHRSLQRALTGFAAGVMVAASVWSLLIPAMNHAGHMGKFAFIPAVAGLMEIVLDMKGALLPIAAVIVLTTVIVMAVTGRTAQWLIRREAGRKHE